jgi:hypothetical protein
MQSLVNDMYSYPGGPMKLSAADLKGRRVPLSAAHTVDNPTVTVDDGAPMRANAPASVSAPSTGAFPTATR